MVRRLLSFGDGLVPGAMLNFQGILSSCWKLKSNVTITSDLLPICANSMRRKVLDRGVSLNGGTTKHPQMIMFSRNTHGCWVPPFSETPISTLYGSSRYLKSRLLAQKVSLNNKSRHVVLQSGFYPPGN